ncbi:Hypothetical protein GL50581_4536 [Giardia duodenalis ATCC 50581]|uniref:Protein LTV1 homolog n=1 Tax=Giardia intestinalis (strain ATCC 50581 / GS clone H7) TaxID=598745 RepID=C6M0E8_GIAIB|nr:Hypothetical protein GL50581_4536 [Giardia intestinalis ATCC 50581]
MHPKKAKRVFNVMNIVSEDGKMMVALKEVETHTHSGEKLHIHGLEERRHNDMFILGEAKSPHMVLSTDVPSSEELIDWEDGTLVNYDGILVVDKAAPKRAIHKQRDAFKDTDLKDASLIIEEECLSEEEVEHIIESTDEHTGDSEAMSIQDKDLMDDLSADELNQLDEELDAIMNAEFDSFKEAGTAAEIISAEQAIRGDDLRNWTSYSNKHETVLDLTRPQEDQKEFVSKTYMIGTTRIVAASKAVKRVLMESLFPNENTFTNADLEGLEFVEEESWKNVHNKKENNSTKRFDLGLELEEEEKEAKEALDFFDANITSNSTALNRAALDGIRGLACLPTKEEEDHIVYGDEVDIDNIDDGKSAVSRRTRLSRLSSVGGYTNLSKLSNKSVGSSVQMRRGRHMNQKHFASGESMDNELNRMMDVANEKITRMQAEYDAQNDQTEPSLTNAQKLALLTEESIQHASLENLYNMEDDVNHGLDKHLGTNMMDNKEIVDGLVDCIMSGQVARAYIRCSWNKLGYGKQKLEAQRKPTIEDDAETLHYIGKADDKSMQMDVNKAPVKIVLSKRGIPITSLNKDFHSLPVVHEENEDCKNMLCEQEEADSSSCDVDEQYKPYVLPSTRSNETSAERADRKALTKQIKRERRAQKKMLGNVFSNERRAQAAVQFRERSNVQGRRIA